MTDTEMSRVIAKLDEVISRLGKIETSVAVLESHDPQNIKDKHAELDKRVVSLETKSLFVSGGISTVTAAIVATLLDTFGGGPK